MPDEVTAERIAALAAAARVPLAEDAAARIARAVTPTVARFTQEKLTIALETEPATFVAMQRRDAGL